MIVKIESTATLTGKVSEYNEMRKVLELGEYDFLSGITQGDTSVVKGVRTTQIDTREIDEV